MLNLYMKVPIRSPGHGFALCYFYLTCYLGQRQTLDEQYEMLKQLPPSSHRTL